MDRYYPLDEMQCRHGEDYRSCGDCLAEETSFDDVEQYRGFASWEQISNWVAR